MLIRENKFVFILTIFSVFAIVFQALFRSGLGFDETYLVLSFFEDGYAHLFKPLVRNQMAPIGFLFLEQFCYHLIPNGLEADLAQYFLRIPVVLAGLFSLVLFYPFIYKITKDKLIATIAFILFACNPFFIYYSSEVKQYIFELLFAILILYSYYNYSENKNYISKKIFRSTMTVSIFFSFSAVFILFAIGLYDLICSIKSKCKFRETAMKLFSLYATPFFIILAYYFVFLHNHPTLGFMHGFWDNKNDNIFSVLGDITFLNEFLLIPLIALGLLAMEKLKKRKMLFIIIVSSMTHVLFSYLKIYPASKERIIFYLYALVPVVLSYGLCFVYELFKKYSEKEIKNIFIGSILAVYIMILSAGLAFGKITFPLYLYGKDIRSEVEYMVSNYKEGDEVYLDSTSNYYPFMDVIDYYEGMGLVPEGMNIKEVIIDGKNQLRYKSGEKIDKLCNIEKRTLVFSKGQDKHASLVRVFNACEVKRYSNYKDMKLYIVGEKVDE